MSRDAILDAVEARISLCRDEQAKCETKAARDEWEAVIYHLGELYEDLERVTRGDL